MAIKTGLVNLKKNVFGTLKFHDTEVYLSLYQDVKAFRIHLPLAENIHFIYTNQHNLSFLIFMKKNTTTTTTTKKTYDI